MRQTREGPRAIILDDAGFPLWPGGTRKRLRDCNADEVQAYHEAQAKKEAAADLAGADELEAAVSAFKRALAEKAWSLGKKARYVVIVGEVKVVNTDSKPKTLKKGTYADKTVTL